MKPFPFKNKQDKRYLKSKNSLEGAYFIELKKQGIIGLQSTKIYRRAKVHSSTFVRHYHNLKGLDGAVRTEVKRDYNATLRRIAKHSAKFSDLVYATFSFLEQHQDFFMANLAMDNTAIFEWIGERLWKYTTKTNYRFGMERIKGLYAHEISAVLIGWMKHEHCNPEKAKQYAKYIIKLSDNAPKRLGFMADGE